MRRPFLAVAVAVAVATGCAHFNRDDPASTRVQRGGHARAAAGPVDRVRVVTFNVHSESAATIAAAVRDDPALRRGDLLMLQEMEEYPGEPGCRARQVAAALGMAWAYAPGYGHPGGGSHGVALLSRWPLRDLQVIELPRNDTVVNSARRVALGATVAAPGGPLRVYSVHLDNRIDPDLRVAQLAPVIAAAAEQPIERVIVAGDFNTSPFRWLGHLIPLPAGGQLAAVEHYVRAHGYSTPVTGSGPTSQWFGMRLDAVYLRGLRGGAFAVERSVRISDHFPLWVDVLLPAPEAASSSNPISTASAWSAQPRLACGLAGLGWSNRTTGRPGGATACSLASAYAPMPTTARGARMSMTLASAGSHSSRVRRRSSGRSLSGVRLAPPASRKHSGQ